eukprot:c14413_g1_i1 orf=413-1150(-)
MATSCASCLPIFPANRHLNSRLPTSSAALRCSLPASDHHQDAAALRLDGWATTRRQLTGHLLLSLLAFPALPAIASDENAESVGVYSQYANDDDKYSLLIPPNWIQGTGKATGQRNVTAFFPADDTSVNVNILITGIGADYTSLGSFGTIDAFAETLVNGLDRSWKKPAGQAAKLVNSKSNKGLYYVEYTVQQPGEKKRHLVSVIGMRFNGWYNRLYTVTGQYWEDDKAKYGPVLEKVVDSFKFA